MKSIISHIISFITMILIIILISFIFIQINFRDRFILKSLNDINYYNDAYNNIILKIDYEIVNEEIKQKYKSYVTKDMIKKDIKSIVSSKKNITHYKEFYNIIKEYTSDTDICDKYAKSINNIYTSNIFPISEYKLISRLYIDTKEVILYSSVLISIIVVFELLLLIINKSLMYNKVTILSSSIVIMLPYIFVLITDIFKNFIYTNKYYTKFLIKLLSNIKNSLFILGLVIIIIVIIKEVLKKSRK